MSARSCHFPTCWQFSFVRCFKSDANQTFLNEHFKYFHYFFTMKWKQILFLDIFRAFCWKKRCQNVDALCASCNPDAGQPLAVSELCVRTMATLACRTGSVEWRSWLRTQRPAVPGSGHLLWAGSALNWMPADRARVAAGAHLPRHLTKVNLFSSLQNHAPVKSRAW